MGIYYYRWVYISMSWFVWVFISRYGYVWVNTGNQELTAPHLEIGKLDIFFPGWVWAKLFFPYSFLNELRLDHNFVSSY